MRFADCLSAPLSAAARPSLKKSLVKAGAGILGLASLPLLAGGGTALGPALKMTVALAGACALAFVVLRALSRRGAGSGAGPELKVVSRASLSPKNGVALLEADGRRYLVAFGDGFTTLLSNAAKAPETDGETR
jgi:hypothetical protein